MRFLDNDEIDYSPTISIMTQPGDPLSTIAGSPYTNELQGRQWGGISRELGRIKQFDQDVRTTIGALWARIDVLEADNDKLRSELTKRPQFEIKE